MNAVKGISALQLGRDLDVQYKTAFVLAHKLREAIAKEQSEAQLSGVVEVDGAYFGGHVKQENAKADRKDRRLASERTGKRQSVVVARERQGKTLPFVVAKEADAVALIRQAVAVGSIVPCRRGERLGPTARLLRRDADQPLGGVLQGRRLHQPGRKLLLPPAPGRAGPAPPHQRQVPTGLCRRDGVA